MDTMNEWKPYPDSPGDWIAMQNWGCGCCVHSIAMAWVLSDDESVDTATEIINGYRVIWQTPKDKHMFPNAWLKVQLPSMDEMFQLEDALVT